VVRQFGWVCLVVFGGIGLFQMLNESRPVLGGVLVSIGIGCAILGAVAPRIFRWCYTGAMLVAFPIGFIVAQVVLAILFFVVFLCVGLFLRVRGVDLMLRRRRSKGATYWTPKPMPTDPRRYLRQY
jgi:hypothetical protein